jgi:hypothetical protein
MQAALRMLAADTEPNKAAEQAGDSDEAAAAAGTKRIRLSRDQLVLARVAVKQVVWCSGVQGNGQQQQQQQQQQQSNHQNKKQRLGSEAEEPAAPPPTQEAADAAASAVAAAHDVQSCSTPQMFSLAVTALKYAAATAVAGDSESLRLQLACCLLGSVASSSSSSSSSASAAGGTARYESAVLQVVLVACSLQLLGVLLEGVVEEAEAATAKLTAAIEAAGTSDQTADEEEAGLTAAVLAAAGLGYEAAAAAADAAAESSDEAAAQPVAEASFETAAGMGAADRTAALSALARGFWVEHAVAGFFEAAVPVTPWRTATPLQCMAQAAAWLQQQLPLLAASQQQTPAAAAAAASGNHSVHQIPRAVVDDLLQRLSCLADSAGCSTWQDLNQQQQQQQQQQGNQGDEEAPAAAAGAAAAVTLAQTLQQLGAAVASQLPLPYCCNKPACSNLDALSEQMLVSGKSTKCGGCRLSHYCSDTC